MHVVDVTHRTDHVVTLLSLSSRLVNQWLQLR